MITNGLWQLIMDLEIFSVVRVVWFLRLLPCLLENSNSCVSALYKLSAGVLHGVNSTSSVSHCM